MARDYHNDEDYVQQICPATQLVSRYLVRILDDTLELASSLSIYAYQFDLVPGHGVVVGNTMCFREGPRCDQVRVTAVSTDAITVNVPLSFAYTTAAEVVRAEHDMASATASQGSPLSYIAKPPPESVWHIHRVLLRMEASGATAMDDSKFGNIAALTNGVLLRARNGETHNIFFAITNGEIAERAYDAEYPTKVPAGVFAFRARMTFGGPDKHGAVISLDGAQGDYLELLVQDPINALDHVHMVCEGKYLDQFLVNKLHSAQLPS